MFLRDMHSNTHRPKADLDSKMFFFHIFLSFIFIFIDDVFFVVMAQIKLKKTKKWTNRIFYHMLDVAMVNSYILFHRLHPNYIKKPLPDYRVEVAELLCTIETLNSAKEARPSICLTINYTTT